MSFHIYMSLFICLFICSASVEDSAHECHSCLEKTVALMGTVLN